MLGPSEKKESLAGASAILLSLSNNLKSRLELTYFRHMQQIIYNQYNCFWLKLHLFSCRVSFSIVWAVLKTFSVRCLESIKWNGQWVVANDYHLRLSDDQYVEKLPLGLAETEMARVHRAKAQAFVIALGYSPPCGSPQKRVVYDINRAARASSIVGDSMLTPGAAALC